MKVVHLSGIPENFKALPKQTKIIIFIAVLGLLYYFFIYRKKKKQQDAAFTPTEGAGMAVLSNPDFNKAFIQNILRWIKNSTRKWNPNNKEKQVKDAVWQFHKRWKEQGQWNGYSYPADELPAYWESLYAHLLSNPNWETEKSKYFKIWNL